VEQHRVAVRRGALDIEAADRRVAAGAVLNDELHVALGLHLGRDQAGESVDAAAGRDRDDDADRTTWERRLRAQHARREDGAHSQHSDCIAAIDARHKKGLPERPRMAALPL
jgi:hypothetical protein